MRGAGNRKERSGRSRPLAVVGAAALVFAIGLVAGRWTAGGNEPSRSAVTGDSRALVAPESAPSAPKTPSLPQDVHSGDGAVAATAAAMTALARPELLFDQTRRRAVVERIATPAYRPELQALFDRGYDYMAGRLGSGDSDGVLMRLVPLGHRLESLSRSRANVVVWQVLLLGAPGGRVVASWSTSRAELHWVAGRWRVAAFAPDEAGPGPAVTNIDTATPPQVFAARLHGIRPFSP